MLGMRLTLNRIDKTNLRDDNFSVDNRVVGRPTYRLFLRGFAKWVSG